MRVIEEISDPRFKISIFYMNQKYLLKFERQNLEQTYKLSELDFIIQDVNDLKRLLNESFLQTVNTQFDQMRLLLENQTEELF